MENGSYSIFVNGSNFDQSIGRNTQPTTGATLNMGRTFGGINYFQGALDDLRIYDRVLTRRRGQGPPRPGAVALFALYPHSLVDVRGRKRKGDYSSTLTLLFFHEASLVCPFPVPDPWRRPAGRP